MYRKKILLFTIALLSATGLTQAKESKLSSTLDFTYMSKWMTKGKEGYGQQGGLFKTIDLDLWATGFGVAVTHQEATASGYVNKERFNYKVYYGNSLFDEQPFKINYQVNWTYKHYPDEPRDARNTQEWKFVFSWPDILPGGLIPKYTAYYEYPAGSHYDNRTKTGWVHLFGLSYKVNVPKLPEPLNLSAEIAYRDGLDGGSVDHDWSHSTFGVSTKLKITDRLSFVPALYHQISMDDSVCKRDVTYCILSMKYKF